MNWLYRMKAAGGLSHNSCWSAALQPLEASGCGWCLLQGERPSGECETQLDGILWWSLSLYAFALSLSLAVSLTVIFSCYSQKLWLLICSFCCCSLGQASLLLHLLFIFWGTSFLLQGFLSFEQDLCMTVKMLDIRMM